MPTYADVQTTTYGTTAVTSTFDVSGPARIKGAFATSTTGTGIIFQIEFGFTGMKKPQKYLLPVHNALEGTEVGAGTTVGRYLPLDIEVPSGVSAVKVTVTASADSQTGYLCLIWQAS